MCFVPQDVYAARRRAVIEAAKKRGERALLVFPSAPVFTRNNDVEHEYRQDSDFFYLTGFDEPSSVLILLVDSGQTVMFVRPRDPERETWDGPRQGAEGVKKNFGADTAFHIGDFATELPILMENRERLYYRIGRDRPFDDKILAALDRVRGRAKMGVGFPTEIVDPGPIVHEMRLYKSPTDLEAMKKAASITAEAHAKAMAFAKPGQHEYEVEALLLETFRRHGSERAAYGSIVGSGANATILHYRSNNRKMSDGDLLLIDAGCEYGYFASDVTRTFPVSKKFSKEQQSIYEIVLDAQLAGIEKTKVNGTLDEIHKECVRVITSGLVKLGLLKGEPEKLIAEEAYKPFYMHKTSHWLGMDVHDVGQYFINGKHRPLEAGMVLTIEPGIYIARDEKRVPEEWRGIGVRIEDDILVTTSGSENLTREIPKTVPEILKACQG